MIVIINGSVGAGKTSVSWALLEKFKKSIMLDGDHIGAVHPFEIYDDDRVEYLYDTLDYLLRFHYEHGYSDFVINYVFESPESLKSLTDRLSKTIPDIYCFWITCSPDEHKERILKRNREGIEWELNRFMELHKIQVEAAKRGFIGEWVDTAGKTIDEIAEMLWENVENY